MIWKFLIVCSDHIVHAFQSESTHYSCLNVKELLAWNRREIWSLSDCHWTRTHNHLVGKRTLNYFVNKFKNFIQESMPNGNIDFVTDTILNWESLFALACKKICREKALSSYFKTKDCYNEPLGKSRLWL